MNTRHHVGLIGSILILALLSAGCGLPALTLLRSRKPADVREGLTKIKQEEDASKLRQSVVLLVDIFYWTSDSPGAASHLGLAALDTLATLSVDGASGLVAAFAQPKLRMKLVSAFYKRYQPRSQVASPDRARQCSKALGLLVRQWNLLSPTQRGKVVTVAVRQRCTTARAWLQKRFKEEKFAWYGIMAVDSCYQLKQVWYSFKNSTGPIGNYATALHQACALDKALVGAVGQRIIASTHRRMSKVFNGIGRWPVPDREDLAQGQAGLDGPFPTVARKLRLSGVAPNVKEAAEAFCAVNNSRLQGNVWKNFRLRSGLLGRLLLHAQIKAADCLKAGCQQTAECAKQGLCSKGAEGLACVAGSDEDCKGAEACTEGGRCKASNGKCVAADSRACKGSTGCSKTGACSIKDGECVVATDADCQQAEVCISARRCKAVKGSCQK